ncbi:MAG TPA: DNA internalization-related competence protein ComEC/Rec2 [Anaeromyxobacter sp.]|nr:DNA internalization-related competence protein ComEC/Rec2 [Anaeromyxobacter sp.]
MTHGRPLVWPAAGFLSGVALGVQPLAAPGWLPFLLLLVALPRFRPIAFLAAGWLAAAQARALPAEPPAEPVLLEGGVVDPPQPWGDDVRLRLALRDGARVEVTAPPLAWPLAVGDALRLEARLRRPPGPANPGGRDRAGQLAAAGVAWVGRATGPAIRIARPSPAALLERARARYAAACERHLPSREAALLRAIGVGDRAGLDDATRRSFARSGLAHVLAVSGYHLVVVVFGLWRLLRAALVRWGWLAERTDPGALAAAICLPATAMYALGTGANPPVLRAAVAAAIGLGGVFLRREHDAANALALAALVLLAVEPAAALDPSFQLSFAAVAGLALWAGPLRRAVPFAAAPGTWRRRLGEPLLQGACATVAASLATAPVLAFHFRQLPLLGLPANLAALPLGAGLTLLGAVAGAAASLDAAAAAPFLWAAWPLARALRAISDVAAAPRWSTFGLGSPGLLGAVACAGLALLATRLRGKRRWATAAAAAACLVAPPWLRAEAARARGGLEVIFLSVGQGDAALLRLPDGSAVLVDGGGAVGGGADPGERDVVPLLRDLGVRRLAAVFLSHPHPDHALGLATVLDAFPVAHAFGNGAPGDGEAAAVVARLRPAPLAPGESWERAGVRFQAVGGPRAALGENDASLVLRVEFGRTAILFAGDVEAAGEDAAVRAGGLAADVVKVPHHGSRSSSSPAFVAAVAPRFAVVSAGAGNRFGFPAADVVARWSAAGAQVERTDRGAVRLLSDGARFRKVPAEVVLDPVATLAEGP